MKARLVTAHDPVVWNAIYEISNQAFALEGVGADRTAILDRFADMIGVDAFHAWVQGDTVQGALCVYKAGQWFGGTALPMAGVALVGVGLNHRGKGVAAAMMTARLRLAHEEGYALSTLYASTQGPYRKVGYEQAGSCFRWALSADAAPDLDRTLPIEPIKPDEPVLRGLHRMRATATPGTLDRDDVLWARVSMERTHAVYAWLLGTRDDPQGYVIFELARQDTPHQRVEIRDAVALTPQAIRRLWTLLHDQRSIFREILWYGPSNDPLVTALPEQRAEVRRAERWLLRIVDLGKALSQRGYPAGTDVELHLDVTDPVIKANHGKIVLRVKDGASEVSPGGRGDLHASIGGLAPLYSGLFRAADLARMGLIEGTAASLAAADRLFAGPEPWMSDRF